MNSTSPETILNSFSQECIDLNIFRTMKPESTSKAALFQNKCTDPVFFYNLLLCIFEA